MKYARLNVFYFGLTAGLIWGIYILALGLTADFTGYGQALVQTFSPIYIGFSSTVHGSIIGGVWAFLDAFVGCIAFSWIYNSLCKLSEK